MATTLESAVARTHVFIVSDIRLFREGLSVLLSRSEADRELINCAEAGISAFVGRDGSREDLLRAIDQVQRGETSLSPHQAMLLLGRVAELAGQRKPSFEEPSLTRREREIIPLIERGLSNKEI